MIYDHILFVKSITQLKVILQVTIEIDTLIYIFLTSIVILHIQNQHLPPMLCSSQDLFFFFFHHSYRNQQKRRDQKTLNRKPWKNLNQNLINPMFIVTVLLSFLSVVLCILVFMGSDGIRDHVTSQILCFGSSMPSSRFSSSTGKDAQI